MWKFHYAALREIPTIQPLGNKMIYLLIILICLICLTLYLGFSKRTDSYTAARMQVAAFVFLLLAFVLAFGIYKENNAKNEIAEYIMPYAGDMSAIYTPIIPGNKSQIWQFQTSDSPKQVEQFYSSDENRKGWNLISYFPFMTLRKGNKEMVISVILIKKTSVTYELREIAK